MNQTVSRLLRLLSMLLDHILCTIIIVGFSMPIYMKMFANFGNEPNRTTIPAAFQYIMILGFAAYFCKDSFGGRSLAKRIIGHQIIDIRTGEAASPMRCMVRNIFCMLWPVEIIMVLITPARRLGDYIAGTKVVNYDAATVSPKRSAGAVLLPYVIIYVVFASAYFVVSTVFPSPFNAYSKYDTSSYNDADSRALQQALLVEFQPYADVEVKVYDKSGVAGKRYVHVLLKLKENYADDVSFVNYADNYVKQQVVKKYGSYGAMGMTNVSYKKGYTSKMKVRMF